VTFQRKLVLVILAIVFVLLVPYFIWHEQMDAYFASESYRQWLLSVRPYAWLVGIGLIGTIVGGLIATMGSILAGLCAYGLSRLLGLKAARFLASESELANLQRFFDSWGAAGIIASRALPVVPEVMTILAGLAKMHFGRFMLALSIGSVPVGFALAWVGETAGTSSSLLLVLTLVPACGWCVYVVATSRRRGAPRSRTPERHNGAR